MIKNNSFIFGILFLATLDISSAEVRTTKLPTEAEKATFISNVAHLKKQYENKKAQKKDLTYHEAYFQAYLFPAYEQRYLNVEFAKYCRPKYVRFYTDLQKQILNHMLAYPPELDPNFRFGGPYKPRGRWDALRIKLASEERKNS